MKKIKTVIAFVLGLYMISSATSNYQGGVNIGRLTVDNQGIWIGFNSKPSDCGGSYYGWYGLIPNTLPYYKDLLSVLLTAKTTGVTVDIWYSSQSTQYACSSPGTLLPIYGVGFSQ